MSKHVPRKNSQWTYRVTLYKRKGDIICERFVDLVSLITSKDIHERIRKHFFQVALLISFRTGYLS